MRLHGCWRSVSTRALRYNSQRVNKGRMTERNLSDESLCLQLYADGHVKPVTFNRRAEGGIDASAAKLLGLTNERVRAYHLPMFEKKYGITLHMVMDLDGVKHNLPHNTNATQLFLVSHLPEEPPRLPLDSINGNALLTAEDVKSEEYVDLDLGWWEKIKGACKEIQPNAVFED